MSYLKFSVEVFPPKQGQDEKQLKNHLAQLSLCNLEFISITCGAGGTQNTNNLPHSFYARETLNLAVVSHLTCAGVSKAQIESILEQLRQNSVTAILALRGDAFKEDSQQQDFRYATDLCELIKQAYPSANIYVAGYPEGHQYSANNEENFQYQLHKAKTYAKGVVTQLFFDNTKFERYLNKMRQAGFTGTVHAGILPISNLKRLDNILTLSNASLPKELSSKLAKYRNDEQAIRDIGIEYALQQIEQLRNINPYIHLYTLNNASLTETVLTEFQSKPVTSTSKKVSSSRQASIINKKQLTVWT